MSASRHAARLLAVLAALAAPSPSLQAASHPRPASRVVTLAPNLAQLVCAAGGCDKLVGVSAYTRAPPQAAKLPQIGGAWGLNYEAVLSLRPDLVLAWHSGTPTQRIRKLRRLGLEVRVITTHSLGDVATALQAIGGWLGTQDVANRAAAHYRQQLAQLRTRYAHAAPVRVFFQIGTQPAYTINRKSPISAALAVCGGVNVFADLPRIAEPVSREAVLAANPQVVLFGQDASQGEIDVYWSQLRHVAAKAHQHIFAVDVDHLTGTPEVIDGIRQVCKLLDTVRADTRVSLPTSP